MKSAGRPINMAGAAAPRSVMPASCLRSTQARCNPSGGGLPVPASRSPCLPATDLYLIGRDAPRSVPRGVAPEHRLLDYWVICSLSTNNVLNPFTPFGDCSLIRIANLYANVAQAGQSDELTACLEMVTTFSARLMNPHDYGIAVGNRADIVVLDCLNSAAAVAGPHQLFAARRRVQLARDCRRFR
jgi:cytosine deaminase